MLTRDALFKSALPFQKFEAFGQACSLRVLSGREAEIVFGATKTQAGGAKETELAFVFKCVSYFLGDVNGLRIIGDTDIEKLKDLDIRELHKIFAAGMKLNKIGEDDEAKKA